MYIDYRYIRMQTEYILFKRSLTSGVNLRNVLQVLLHVAGQIYDLMYAYM